MPRPSQTHSQRSDASDLEEDFDEDHLVTNMVKTILNLSMNKRAIKKGDIASIALKGHARLLKRLLPEVIEILYEIYGYQLIEVENSSPKTIILCSTLETTSLAVLNQTCRQEYTFLYLVLSYIYMKYGTVPEGLLWEFLATIGVSQEQWHPYFGDTKKLFEEFIKQAYIVRFKQSIEGMYEETVSISWGVRAEHEVSKKRMLESLCNIMDRDPSDFRTQYIETQESEETTVVEEE